MFSNIINGVSSMLGNLNNSGLLKTGMSAMFPEGMGAYNLIGGLINDGKKLLGMPGGNGGNNPNSRGSQLRNFATNAMQQGGGQMMNMLPQGMPQGIPQEMGAFGRSNPFGSIQQQQPMEQNGMPNYYPQPNGNLGKRQMPYGYMEDDGGGYGYDEEQEYAPMRKMQMMGPSGSGMESMGGMNMMSGQMQAAPPYAFMRPPRSFQNQPQNQGYNSNMMIGGGPGSTYMGGGPPQRPSGLYPAGYN